MNKYMKKILAKWNWTIKLTMKIKVAYVVQPPR